MTGNNGGTTRPPLPHFDPDLVHRVTELCRVYQVPPEYAPRVVAILWSVASSEPAIDHGGEHQ